MDNCLHLQWQLVGLSSKAHKIIIILGDAGLLILSPLETREVDRDNAVILGPNLHHQSSYKPYSTDDTVARVHTFSRGRWKWVQYVGL